MSFLLFRVAKILRRKSLVLRLFLWVSLLFGHSASFAQSTATVVPVPSNAHALVYSTTAAELFFTPVPGTLTHITQNGIERTLTDARSYWLEGLDTSIEHRLELRSVSAGSTSNPLDLPAASITIFTGDFTPPTYRVEAANVDGVALANSDDNVSAASVSIVSIQTNPTQISDTSIEFIAQPSPESVSVAEVASACNVSTVSQLITCVNQASRFDLINVRNDLSCVNGECCPSGNAMMELRGINNLTIEGNGTRLLRSSGQRQCSLIDVIGGSNITFQNWSLDDDLSVESCALEDRCPRMVHVRNAQNIVLDNVTVQNGKGYTVYVDQVNGFEFTNSRLINSGVLGLYIGHSNRSSTNVLVENSLFVDNQTNALALLGVTGNSPNVNIIRNNRFFRNHRLGQFPVAERFGSGITNGGQVYLAQVSGATFENNTLRDGYCENCFVQARTRSGITGLELGIPGQATVSNVRILNNTIEHHDGSGIRSNSSSTIPSNVIVQNNVLNTNTVGLNISGGQASNNTERNTRWFQSFEGGNDLSSLFNVSASCPGAVVRRVCGASEARFGSCVAQVSTSTSNNCVSDPVRLTTQSQSVSAGQEVQASAWVSSTAGSWCLIFSNNGQFVSERCESLSQTPATLVNNLLGTPSLSAQVPSGVNQFAAELRVTQSGARVVVDDVKLSGY